MSDGIYLHDVSFRYVGAKADSLSHLTMHIKKGTFLGVTGTNGSGKTTLSYLLNGLIPSEIDGTFAGEVSVDGEDTRSKSVPYFAKKVGMVFQNPDHMIFNLTVAEEVEFALKNQGHKDYKTKALHALATLDLAKYKDLDPNSLSFGQKQKLCIACALAVDTEYLVLDEPSSMLDYKSSLDLYDILSKLSKGGKTIIVIEHDTDFIFSYASETLILDNGSLCMYGTKEVVFANKEKIKNMGIKVPRKIE